MSDDPLIKDPAAVLDYAVDWSEWLGSDAIVTSTWTAQGVTVDSDEHDGRVATAWLSGGTAGQRATATNHVITAAGREDERTRTLHIMDR
jgi:hypothetical protein